MYEGIKRVRDKQPKPKPTHDEILREYKEKYPNGIPLKYDVALQGTEYVLSPFKHCGKVPYHQRADSYCHYFREIINSYHHGEMYQTKRWFNIGYFLNHRKSLITEDELYGLHKVPYGIYEAAKEFQKFFKTGVNLSNCWQKKNFITHRQCTVFVHKCIKEGITIEQVLE